MKYQLFLGLVFALFPTTPYAQTVTIQGKCGDTLESEFKNSTESQNIEISLLVGDLFEVMVVPLGDDLRIRAEMFDINNAPMENEEPTDLMFKDETVRSITLYSGVVTSSGTFKIKLFNYQVEPDKTGVYNVYIKCIKSNGDILNPK